MDEPPPYVTCHLILTKNVVQSIPGHFVNKTLNFSHLFIQISIQGYVLNSIIPLHSKPFFKTISEKLRVFRERAPLI